MALPSDFQNPTGYDFSDPRTTALKKAVFSPGSMLLSEMNLGKRPFRSMLARMFAGRGDGTRVSTRRDTRDTGRGVSTPRFRDWIFNNDDDEGGGKSTLSS